MEGITWRTANVRGLHAKGDISLGLSKHAGRHSLLRVGIKSAFMGRHPYNYMAISDFMKDNGKIYFMFSDGLEKTFQNKIHRPNKSGQVLFTLRNGEEKAIEAWCGSQYELKHYDKDIYYIEREVTNE